MLQSSSERAASDAALFHDRRHVSRSYRIHCGRASITSQLQNVHAGIGPVDDIDVAAVVGFDVVALDRRGAALLAVDLEAALLGCFRHRRDEMADLPGMIRIAHVERPHPAGEIGDEGEFLVKHRRRALVGGMGAEAHAAVAIIAAALRHREIRDHHGLCLDADVGEPHHLVRLLAAVGPAGRLADDHDEIAHRPDPRLREFGQRHLQQWKGRVRAVKR